VSGTLAAAWDTYEGLGYRMPPPTPGRSDDLITVLVEGEPFMVSVYPHYATGASYGGRIWIRNNLDTTGGSTKRLWSVQLLAKLTQCNYNGLGKPHAHAEHVLTCFRYQAANSFAAVFEAFNLTVKEQAFVTTYHHTW
jgi:hypothetical protein